MARSLIVKIVLGCCVLGIVAACGRPIDTAHPQGSGEPRPEATVSGPPAQPTGDTGQGSGVVQSHGGAVKDHVSFVDYLCSQGLTVEIIGDTEQPFLRGKGTQLRVSGGKLTRAADIQSYHYDDTALKANGVAVAAADVDGIAPDGNPRTMRISWVATPHFFHRERIIVLYLGDDPAVLTLLTKALGQQFAGG